MGVVVSETTMETMMATESVTANSRNRRPTMPPISSSGMNTAISEMLMVNTVKPISCAPLSAACEGRHPLLQVARDVFDDHDGVVHHKSGGDGQRHQREIVEADSRTDTSRRTSPMSETGTATLGMNVVRDACAGKTNTTRITSATEMHQRDFHIVHRSADGDGLVHGHLHVDGLRAWRLSAAAEPRGCDPRCR